MPGPIDYLMNLRYGKKNSDGTRYKSLSKGDGKDIPLPNESGNVDPRLPRSSSTSDDAFKQAEALTRRNKAFSGSK